ncbi:hypothetical protein GKKCFE_16725 [Pseudomonas sp. E141]|nr:hypothetical protein [Pseudomonas sp. N-137]MEA1028379.1 hypothetical protein [Pseudomonas sp. N-137]
MSAIIATSHARSVEKGQIYFYFAALRVFIEWIRLDQLAAG